AIPIDLTHSQLGNLAISGILGLVFGDSFLFKSYEYNGARISALIMSAAPAIAALFAYFVLDETLSLWGFVGMAVTLGGIVLVVADRQDSRSTHTPITARGIFFAFLGACGQGGGLVTAKLAFNEHPIDSFAATMVRILSALAILIPLAIISGRVGRSVRVWVGDRKTFGLTLLGAILGPYLGITFSLLSIEHTKVAVASTIMATVPIIMLPLVRIVYRENLRWRAYAGAFVAVGGVAILFLR
ncbi:MAG TPA: DMT family transporter, partial [Bacteroidota bacterium]|nr:DMT family transporter [Bacteroidota bacterium]